jgi:hypothetical protein
MPHQNIDSDTLLSRAETASALTAAGYPIATATLDTMATRGGGPPFRKFGKWPRYRWGNAVDWAQARTSPLVHSTSELDRSSDPTASIAASDTSDPETVTCPHCGAPVSRSADAVAPPARVVHLPTNRAVSTRRGRRPPPDTGDYLPPAA